MRRWFRASLPSAGVAAWPGGLLGGAVAVLLTVDAGPKAWLEAASLAAAAAAVWLLYPGRTPDPSG